MRAVEYVLAGIEYARDPRTARDVIADDMDGRAFCDWLRYRPRAKRYKDLFAAIFGGAPEKSKALCDVCPLDARDDAERAAVVASLAGTVPAPTQTMESR